MGLLSFLSPVEDRIAGLLGYSPTQAGGDAPAAGPSPATPQPQAPGYYQPSKLDILGRVLSHWEAPDDAAMDLRQRHYQLQMLQAMPGMIDAIVNPDRPAASASPAGDGLAGGTNTAAPMAAGSPATMGGVAPPAAPGSGMSLANPRIQRALVAGALTGVLPNVDKVTSVLQAAQPDVAYDRGFGYNKKTGLPIGGYHPDVDKGQIPLFDANGNFAGVRNADGAVQSAADLERAKAGGKAAGEAPWTLVDIPQSDGSTIKVPLSVAAPALAKGLGAGAGSPAPATSAATGNVAGTPTPALGRTPTTAETELAKKRAATQGEREQLQPKEWGALQDLDRMTAMSLKMGHQILGDVQDPKTGQWSPGGKPKATMWTTGGIGELGAHIPGTPAYDLDQQLEHWRAMTSMEELQNLRDNSPTGAGLGRVTQQEISLLASLRGSLDQGQSLPQFTQNLRQQIDQLEKIQANRHGVYNQTYGDIQQPSPGATQPLAPKPQAGPSRAALEAEARRRGLIK